MEKNKRKFETEDNNAAHRRRAENVSTLYGFTFVRSIVRYS